MSLYEKKMNEYRKLLFKFRTQTFAQRHPCGGLFSWEFIGIKCSGWH